MIPANATQAELEQRNIGATGMHIQQMLQTELRKAAGQVNARLFDLCIVGRPELVRELRKIGIHAEAVPGLSTYNMGGGKFSSDVHIIMRRDLWAWRGRGMRAKLLRSIAP